MGTALDAIRLLVDLSACNAQADRFDQNRDAYLSGDHSVTRMMELKKQQTRAPKKQSPSQKQLLDQKTAITDHQIDALVYELYGLSEAEIKVVEGVG
jgi:hypothetical protein